jgi:signal transduction histidine kinase
VLAYSETQSGRKRYHIEPLALADVVDRALRSFDQPLRESGAAVTVNIEPDLPPVMADASTLTRCIENLLSNAIKYGGRKGIIRISIDGVLDAVSGKVRLSVSDEGFGVPDQDVAHLFEPFHRGSNAATHTPGNGLGLHLVRKMMEAQKGSVEYRAVPSGGAKFILTLPAGDSEA